MFRIGAVAALLLLIASACSAVQIIEDAADPAPPATVLGTVEFPEIEGEVVVGLVADLSGDNSDLEGSFGEQLTSAIELRNADGGVLGDPVGLLVRDTANDVDEAIDAVEDLIRREVDVIIVGCELETVLPAASIANEMGVLVVSPCVSTDEFSAVAGELAFSFAATDLQQGIVMADHAIDIEATSAITVADIADPTAFDRCQAFTERFETSGGSISATIEYGADGLPLADVGATVGEFVTPGVVVLCANPADLRVITRQLRELGPVPIMLGSEGDTLFWLQGQPDLSDTWFVSSSSLYGLRSQVETDYIRSLSPAPSGSADLLVSASFLAFVGAAEATGSLDGADLAEHLSVVGASDYLITSASFGDENAFTPQGLAIVAVANGFPSLLTVLDPAAPPAPAPPPVPTTLVPPATTVPG